MLALHALPWGQAPQEAREKAAWMVAHSIHVYSPSWKSALGDYHKPRATQVRRENTNLCDRMGHHPRWVC